MRGRILKTIIATTLAGIMLASGSGCGSNQPTTTATSTPPVDVIKQIEEDCGIRSQRGETVFYEWWSYDRDDDTVQCLLNAMLSGCPQVIASCHNPHTLSSLLSVSIHGFVASSSGSARLVTGS